MAEKKKSIIEEALLEAKSLEDALKANTKEMLAAHMSKEIESIVESSLKNKDEKKEEPISEEDEEISVDDVETKGSDDDEEDVKLYLDDEKTLMMMNYNLVVMILMNLMMNLKLI
jgi:hypothetical protein